MAGRMSVGGPLLTVENNKLLEPQFLNYILESRVQAQAAINTHFAVTPSVCVSGFVFSGSYTTLICRSPVVIGLVSNDPV